MLMTGAIGKLIKNLFLSNFIQNSGWFCVFFSLQERIFHFHFHFKNLFLSSFIQNFDFVFFLPGKDLSLDWAATDAVSTWSEKEEIAVDKKE